jgi:hypothetical protein
MKEPWSRALDAYRQVLVARIKESHFDPLHKAARHGGDTRLG